MYTFIFAYNFNSKKMDLILTEPLLVAESLYL